MLGERLFERTVSARYSSTQWAACSTSPASAPIVAGRKTSSTAVVHSGRARWPDEAPPPPRFAPRSDLRVAVRAGLELEVRLD